VAGPPRASFPSAPSEPSLRRLGVGGGGGDRPVRAQLVIALVAILVLLAVPLYLWRRPSASEAAPSDAGMLPPTMPNMASAPDAAEGDAGVSEERVRLGPVQRVKCAASARAAGQEGPSCDPLPSLERGLTKAIRDTVDCAPRGGKVGSINYVLEVDFNAKNINIFPGASGEWKGPQAKKATVCVERAFPSFDWTTTVHQYRFYRIAILATYLPPKPPAVPLFE
jgi:hypothetical protein